MQSSFRQIGATIRFPDVLEAERQHDLKVYPERRDHKGSYVRAFEGAYFARQLNEARQQKRIGFVAADPILPIRAFFDIGGSGFRSQSPLLRLARGG
jgi:phage terminase large subunit